MNCPKCGGFMRPKLPSTGICDKCGYRSRKKGVIRKPKCPECGDEMTLMRPGRHHHFLCESKKHGYPVGLGIVGEPTWFQFKQNVDPVTLKIVDNPYYKSSASTIQTVE